MKKAYLIMAILTILLYAALVLNHYNVVTLWDLFGYLLYAIIAVGIVAAISLFIKPTKKE